MQVENSRNGAPTIRYLSANDGHALHKCQPSPYPIGTGQKQFHSCKPVPTSTAEEPPPAVPISSESSERDGGTEGGNHLEHRETIDEVKSIRGIKKGSVLYGVSLLPPTRHSLSLCIGRDLQDYN
jgi:hypothetical protein